ncbi:MAG: hypothetical protein COX70_09895 [Flavobacteriales bacterium CG_4_10_14_0_2_um_filter_32_8]|nr:MAG: hypothetical protein COX70_09895 [Flavobacteriales bacterium CG_4_10_14_0_2_um_filter_32_8]PJB14895.1 MAG: hypothetical protein CO118_06180 [Flavobacteriales bacterium CG_4_9_14_3_um_filter_32_8]
MTSKKHSILFLLVVVLSCSNTFAQCERLTNKRIYQLLGAAEYDNARVSEITTSENTSKEEYQIDLFKGVVYKLVFDVSKMPEGVVINLHDIGNKRGVGKYELVFSSETAEKTKDDTYEITLEFPQKKLMVSYEIVNDTKPGCVAFVLGYYFKNRIR